jgi:hypothetical protein
MGFSLQCVRSIICGLEGQVLSCWLLQSRAMRVGEAAPPPPHQGDNKSSFQAAEERGNTARQRVTARLTALSAQVNSVTSTSPRGRTILISLGEHAA